MASRLRELILPGTMSFIVRNLPKMSKTEVTLQIWGYIQQNCFKISFNRNTPDYFSTPFTVKSGWFEPKQMSEGWHNPSHWCHGWVLGCFQLQRFLKEREISHASNADHNTAHNFIAGCTSGPLIIWIHLFLTAFGSLKTSLNFPKHSYSHLDCSLWDLNLYLEVLFSIST